MYEIHEKTFRNVLNAVFLIIGLCNTCAFANEDIFNGNSSKFDIYDSLFEISMKCTSKDNNQGFCVPNQQCINGKKIVGLSKACINQTEICCESDYIIETQLKTISYLRTSCQTPNNGEGHCIPIQNCTVLYDQLGFANARQFLRASSCGPKNQNKRFPKVCCGPHGNYINEKGRNKSKVVVPQPDGLPHECGKQKIILENRVFGGDTASLGEFPWMAQLFYNRTTFGCSGFLISEWYVMTAAHCVVSGNLDLYGSLDTIVLGEHDMNKTSTLVCEGSNCFKPKQKLDVKNIIIHHNYNYEDKHHLHDIALIKLKSPAVFNDYVYPICLFQQAETLTEYWISGWGTTETGDISQVKLKTNLPSIDLRNCAEIYGRLGVHVTRNQVCAGGEKKKDSCTGDSGGPLMFYKDDRWFSAGVVSYGLGCGRIGIPGVYTNVVSYKKWIVNHISNKATTSKLKSRKSMKN